MRLVLLKEIPDDSKLHQQWNALVKSVDRPQVFYTYEWALAVQRAYGATLCPLVFLAYDDQESLCGVVALALDLDRSVSFLCATTGDYCDFLSLPEQRPAFVSTVLGELRKLEIKKIALANLPADSSTIAAIRQTSHGHGWLCFARTAYVCAQVSLERLERGRDGNRIAPGQKRVRRFAKAIAPEGAVHFDHNRSWDAVAPMLPQFIRAHVGRFLEIGRISNLANARRRIFLEELAKLLSQPQWLVLSRMLAGERVVAWHYGFQFYDTWFWYQPTFDSRVEKHWPGFCLLTQVIQEATENPALTTLDLGLGSEAYKAKFANESRETLYVTLQSPRLKHWATQLRYRVTEAVKTHPSMEKLVRVLRKEFRELRDRVRTQGLPQTFAWAGRRLLRTIWLRDEVLFFEWRNAEPAPMDLKNVQLCALDLSRLAVAAMKYEGDEATLEYLLRSTQRLRAEGMQGFVLATDDGSPVHFAWVAPFNGFFCAELNATLHGSPDCVLLFDCWTPAEVRGHSYYKRAIELIAARMIANGKQPWIFSAASNTASVRGLEKAGSVRRYSLVRNRLLGWERTTANQPNPDTAPGAEASAHI